MTTVKRRFGAFLDVRDLAWIGFLLVAFVTSRLAWLLWSPETASYWEESYRWIAMLELLDQPLRPLLDYQADHYQGGSLVMILLGLPFLWLGGGSLLAFKLTALSVSTATLLTLYLGNRRFFGRPVAVTAAAAYLVGPPLVAFWGLVVMGFHAESVVFSLAQIFALLGLLSGAWRHRRGWAAFGLACGLGIWFSYTAAISVIACALTWLLLEGLPKPREISAALAGLVAGLFPWLAYNWSHDFAGLGRPLEVFGLKPPADPWASQGLIEKTVDLFTQTLPFGWLDPSAGDALSGPERLLFAVAFAGPLALAMLAGLRRMASALRRQSLPRGRGANGASDRLELVFHLYVLVFLALYLGSRFSVDPNQKMIAYRLFAPLAVLVITPASISLVRARSGSPWARRIALVAGSACFLSMAAATFAFAARPDESQPISVELGYTTFGTLLHRKHEPEVEPSLQMARGIPEPKLRERVLAGIGWGIQDRYELRGTLEEVEATLASIPEGERAQVLAGIAWFALWRIRALEKPPRAGKQDPERPRQIRRLQELLAWAEEARPRRFSVAIITLDTTRVDHLSTYGYAHQTSPALSDLASRAVRFDRVWSTAPWTLPAHASLFTGLYPSTHGARHDAEGAAVLGSLIEMPAARYVRAGRLDEAHTTLAEILSDHGYRTGAFVAGPWMHRSFGLLQGFDTIDDDVTSFGGRSAREVTDRALAWLEELEPSRPYFLFVNYFDPHAPYEQRRGFTRPEGTRPFEPPFEELLSGTRQLTAEEREILHARYDGEIRFMDQQLGRLLAALEAPPHGHEVLTIVTGDHGEAFGEGGRIGHTFWLSEELLRLPLIVRYPHDRGRGTTDASLVQLVDIPPLVAAELGFELPASVEGVAPGERQQAFAEVYREPTSAIRFGPRYDRDLAAVIEGHHMLVRSSRGEQSLLRVDGAADGEGDSVALERLGELLDIRQRSVHRAAIQPARVDPEMVEALRRLGYLSAEPSTEGDEGP